MASYVPGAMTYRQYLQAQAFVKDIQWEVSQDTLKVVASVDDLKKQGVRSITAAGAQMGGRIESLSQQNARHHEAAAHHYEAVESTLQEGFDEVSGKLDEVSGQLENIDTTLTKGFITIHYDLEAVQSSISDLSAKFEWGLYELQTAIGRVNDSLQVLIQIARNPEQTWAFEQFDIARDAFRRKLFDDSLDHVGRAIQGFQNHPGYRLEHRFHYLLGTLRLGSSRSGAAMGRVQDLGKAEEAFLNAAKYAGADYPEDAGRALCYAGYAAYCQQKITDARRYNRQALALHSKLPEGYFQAAKYAFHQKQADDGLSFLKKAIRLDKLYAIKFDDDDDFRPFRQGILDMIVSMRDANARHCRAALKQLRNEIHELAQVTNDNEELSDSMETMRRMLSHAEDALRANTYFSILDAAAGLEECSRMLRSVYELSLQGINSAFAAKHTSLEINYNSARTEAQRKHSEIEKELQKAKDERGATIGRMIGVIVGACFFIVFNAGYILNKIHATVFETIINGILVGVAAYVICCVVAVLVGIPAKVLLTGPANLEIAEGRRKAENELRTIDGTYRRNVADANAERDAVLARCQSVLQRVAKTFSDPWWEDIVAQQHGGHTAGAAHDRGVSGRRIPKMA